MHAQLETSVMTETIRKYPTYPKFFLEKVFPMKTTSAWVAEWMEEDLTLEIAQFQGRGRERTMEAQQARRYRSEAYLHVRPGGFVKSVDMKSLRKPGASDTSSAYGQQLVLDELANMRRKVDRTMEWVGAQALQAASVSLTVDGSTLALTTLNSTNVVTAGAAWSTAGTDILQDIVDSKIAIAKYSGEEPQFILIASSMGRNIVANTVIQNYLVHSKDVDAVIREGRIARLEGLDFYYYDAWYKPATGTLTAVWDDNLVLFGCYADLAKSCMLVGPPEDTDMQAAGDGIGAKSWKSEDPDGINMLADASFYPHLGNRDCFLVLDGTP